MKIGIVGGTGKEGTGMALRWAKAGHEVFIGSRDATRALAKAEELQGLSGGAVQGGDNSWAAQQSAVVVLSVPYDAHQSTLEQLKTVLAGRVVIDITVPLQPPKIRQVHLPPGQSAALEAQALLGSTAAVVAALHHVSAAHLMDLEHTIECDVLACSDDPRALELSLSLIRDLGVRAFDAGPLVNSIALEALTPVLLHLNKQHKGARVGIKLAGV